MHTAHIGVGVCGIHEWCACTKRMLGEKRGKNVVDYPLGICVADSTGLRITRVFVCHTHLAVERVDGQQRGRGGDRGTLAPTHPLPW